jgi:6-phosphofructokinase 1
MQIRTLGEPRFDSPLDRAVSDRVRVPSHIVRENGVPHADEVLFERAGPREKIFFDPRHTGAAIVTCGGLCPGLNNVIRSLFLELYHCYGVRNVIGFRGGYQGLDPRAEAEPLELTCDLVHKIHREGGTILGTSRGPVDPAVALDNLAVRNVNILFTIGGDGTQRGAVAISAEAARRGYPLAVVGVPKTIDNDVPFVSRSFGYLTAIEQAAKVLECAHTECHSVHNGISIVKLMGREAGFIAAGATIASQDVNFTLIPEVPFRLDGQRGFLPLLKERVLKRAHAVIVVAEGAGQDLIENGDLGRDASGNIKLKDVGAFLRALIEDYFKREQVPVIVRYFDPSYVIRSVVADSEDAILCDLFARNAVHAAMAGKTGLIIGLLHDQFIHVPMELLNGEKKRLNPNGSLWHAVLAATGQPARFE